MAELTDLDKRVLTEIQAHFPVAPAPYAVLAERVGATEADVHASVLTMKRDEVIRRIGAIFDSHRLGYRSTLCAIAVPRERVDEVASLIGCYPNVTHNYLREDRYNIWFTLIAESAQRIEQILIEIAAATRIEDILDLPAIRLFKIRVDFDLTGSREGRGEAPPIMKPAETEAVTLSDDEKALARLLQDDLPETLTPFADLAARLRDRGVDVTEEWVIERTAAWVENGVIRRFGAAIKHHKTGFASNAMGVWTAPEDRIEEVGAIMASFEEVSHCYERPKAPTWPANMYTMIHGRSREECEDVARRIREATGLPEPRLLYSVREFKKTSMRYFAE
ncbi:MAG: Lrp/AsnC family transcriptional regulator [Coriobacteriia bacterium]|nr:Lrp/AsnC family transcriptional regulator [Coriobacteriia bacterium]